MKTELVPIGSVQQLDRNPRRHPEKQLVELVKSIEQFGQYRPLVVDEEGNILAGNGLHIALTRAGVEEVSVYRMTGLSESQKTKLILADNRTGDLSNDDFDVIELMVRELQDFEVPGYDPEVLRGIIAEAEDVMEEADSYGILSSEELDGLRKNEERLEEANAGATTGGGGPVEPVDLAAGTATLAEQAEASKNAGDVCPACGRGW